MKSTKLLLRSCCARFFYVSFRFSHSDTVAVASVFCLFRKAHSSCMPFTHFTFANILFFILPMLKLLFISLTNLFSPSIRSSKSFVFHSSALCSLPSPATSFLLGIAMFLIPPDLVYFAIVECLPLTPPPPPTASPCSSSSSSRS